MMMGCCVRETSGGKRMEGDGAATGRRRGGESEEGEKKRGDRGRGRPGREMDVREMESPVTIKGRDDGIESKMGCGVREMEMESLGSASRSGRGSAYHFFWIGLGVLKFRGIRPWLGER